MKEKKQKTAVDILYHSCSHEMLGHVTNYEFEDIQRMLNGSEFCAAEYSKQLTDFSDKKNDVTESIHCRSSHRDFSGEHLTERQLREIIFNGYSMKDSAGSMTIPQAGGLQTMHLHILRLNNNAWEMYRYNPKNYQLDATHIIIDDLAKLFYTQSVAFSRASVCIMISCSFQPFSKVYLSRAFKFGAFQAGHIAQNILLTATMLGLKSIPLGSLIETNITELCGFTDEYPLYAIVLGK